MIESILGVSVTATITDLAALSALTTIIVEVLKQIVPKRFPTSVLAIIVALIVSIVATCLFVGWAATNIIIGIFVGFIVAFVSMNGFDSLKEIWKRYTTWSWNKIQDDENIGEG